MISIGFVLYNPEKDFYDRVELLITSGYKIYIFDNSPEYTKRDVRLQKLFYELNYYTLDKNMGLGVGISSVCYNAFIDSFEALLFFDQDTKFNIETLDYVSRFFVDNKDDFNLYAAIQFSNKFNSSDILVNKFKIEERRLLISSGSLFNLKNLNKINWHNKNYFVDGVDYEFCLRAHSKGYLLGEIVSTPGFDHITGQEDKEYSFLRSKLFLRAYNQSRIKDILISYLKLMIMSVRLIKIKYLLIFMKSFLIFTFYQIFVRVLNLIKKYERI